ncbi:probable pseudouridine-5'-phosphatase [Macrosteles quadrilineatus]|uniref:probable pseudouridine-5'-phosphatase n=1 Tax=Macrosteles quadrilineatus TaxID=74068 RepID=UPI0023E33DA1|nr:probable pseudouridine-5'-phosphatase [Macrosteles quadrilineatus]
MADLIPVSHVIFDLDGLLLDTETIYKEGVVKILAKFGKSYSDDLRLKAMGTKEQEFLKILHEELELPLSLEEFSKEYLSHFTVALANAELKPGAERLIQHFHSKRVPMAVATSSGQETCEVKLKRYSLLCSYFSHIVMGSSDSEVVKGKPAPDIFYVAARRFKDVPSPEKCLVFEDSYNGVMAARAAGMQVVMVPEDKISEEIRKTATVVLSSLEEFTPEHFGLPAFDS